MVKIKVNGREVTADPSLNLLQNLLNNGIFVPNLCYRKELEAYGGCGLCLVEIKGSPKLVRACNAMPAEGMEIETDTDRIRQSRRFTLPLFSPTIRRTVALQEGMPHQSGRSRLYRSYLRRQGQGRHGPYHEG